MTKTSPTATLAVVTAFAASVLSATVAAPIAHADPLDEVREAINTARLGSTCPPLNYSVQLEGEAQHGIGNDLPGVPPAGQYKGKIEGVGAVDDPAAAAIADLVKKAAAPIDNCDWKDFGVGFVRKGSFDGVSVTFGTPAPPPAPPPPSGPPAAVGQRPTSQQVGTVVGGDVPVWDIAHDNVPDPATGVVGAQIGTLTDGSQVALDRPCANGWCHVTSSQIPRGDGFVEQDRLNIHKMV